MDLVKVYIERMTRCQFGHPLSDPSHFPDNKPENQVQIGDVGWFKRDNTWNRLFNVFETREAPENFVPWNRSSPEYQPHTLNRIAPTLVFKGFEDGNATINVNVPKLPVGFQLELHQHKQRGAALILPRATPPQSLHEASLPLIQQRCVLDHNCWLRFAHDVKKKVSLKTTDLVFVFGVVKTSDWAIASSLTHRQKRNITFSVGPSGGPQVSSGLWGEWHNTSNAWAICGPERNVAAKTLDVQEIAVVSNLGRAEESHDVSHKYHASKTDIPRRAASPSPWIARSLNPPWSPSPGPSRLKHQQRDAKVVPVSDQCVFMTRLKFRQIFHIPLSDSIFLMRVDAGPVDCLSELSILLKEDALEVRGELTWREKLSKTASKKIEWTAFLMIGGLEYEGHAETLEAAREAAAVQALADLRPPPKAPQSRVSITATSFDAESIDSEIESPVSGLKPSAGYFDHSHGTDQTDRNDPQVLYDHDDSEPTDALDILLEYIHNKYRHQEDVQFVCGTDDDVASLLTDENDEDGFRQIIYAAAPKTEVRNGVATIVRSPAGPAAPAPYSHDGSSPLQRLNIEATSPFRKNSAQNPSSHSGPPTKSYTLHTVGEVETSTLPNASDPASLGSSLRASAHPLLQDSDIILVIGPSGSGKSTYINRALGGCASTTEHGLGKKLDAPIQPVCCPNPQKESHVIFVDTPGLGDDKAENDRTFDAIQVWMKQTLRHDVRLRGVLYCVSVSPHSSQIPAVKVMAFLSKLFGVGISKNVVLVLTMDTDARFDVPEERLPEFIRNTWSYCFSLGLRAVRFHETYESAWRIFSLLEESTPQMLMRPSRSSPSTSSLVPCHPEAHIRDAETSVPATSGPGKPEATLELRLRTSSLDNAILPGLSMVGPSLRRVLSQASSSPLVTPTSQPRHSWVLLPNFAEVYHSQQPPNISFTSRSISRPLSAPPPISGPTSFFPSPPHSQAISVAPPECIVDSEAWNFFMEEFKDAERYISVSELQKVCCQGNIPALSLDTVKMLMKAFNNEKRGLMPLIEFQTVWVYLRGRLEIFRRFERDPTGGFAGYHLFEALQSSEVGAGYGLSSSTASLMQARYASEFSHDGQQKSKVSFDRFLQAGLLLRLVTHSFKSVDEDGDGWVKVSFDQVMKLVLNAL